MAQSSFHNSLADRAVASACMYEGRVFHKRFRPTLHSLSYSVFAFWVDPLSVSLLARKNRLISHNRFNVFSIYDRDFAAGNLAGIREFLVEKLAPLGDVSGLKDIRLLCYPRIFGYAFNPISVYYCYDTSSDLLAVVYEVNNTFGETTIYPFLMKSGSSHESGNKTQTKGEFSLHSCAKEMHVSPFTPMDMAYQFKLRIPDDILSLSIRVYDAKGTMLTANFRGDKQCLNDARLLRNMLGYPAMTFKVTAGIHWEALKLWIKKVPWFPHTVKPNAADTRPGQ